MYSVVGIKGLSKRSFIISRSDNGGISIIATLPARDSEASSMSLNGCDPVNRYRPFFFLLSHSILIYLNSCGTYWISSIIMGGSFKERNSLGFSLACSSRNSSSNVSDDISLNISLYKVDFPVCRAPVRSTVLNVFSDLDTSFSACLYMYFIALPPS